MEPPTDTQMKWRYAFAVTGILVGLSVAVVFAIVFYNPDTAAWALTSGLFNLSLHSDWFVLCIYIA